MISSEVQRTLVKSPPELWAEISDPEALARHLGEFGEIRITRSQPEQKVEWEADDASGSIVIKPSGWGTKVKLTVTRELSDAEAGVEPDEASEPEQASEPGEGLTIEQPNEPDSVAEGEVELRDELEAATETEVLQETAADEELELAEDRAPASLPLTGHESDPLPKPAFEGEPLPEPEPERRRGLFTRLFGRRRAPRVTEAEIAHDDAPSQVLACEDGADVEAIAAGERAGLEAEADVEVGLPVAPVKEPESDTEARPQAGETSEHPSPTDAAASLAAELEQAEEAATEQVTAVLTGVLDRLGAAHHRPFSRA